MAKTTAKKTKIKTASKGKAVPLAVTYSGKKDTVVDTKALAAVAKKIGVKPSTLNGFIAKATGLEGAVAIASKSIRGKPAKKKPAKGKTAKGKGRGKAKAVKDSNASNAMLNGKPVFFLTPDMDVSFADNRDSALVKYAIQHLSTTFTRMRVMACNYVFSASMLAMVIPMMQSEMNSDYDDPTGKEADDSVEGWKELRHLLREGSEKEMAEKATRLERGVATFTDLISYFAEGDEILITDDDVDKAGTVSNVSVEATFMGVKLTVSYQMIGHLLGNVKVENHTLAITGFNGEARLDSLHIKKLDPAMKEALSKRGLWFRKMTSQKAFLAYCHEGHVTQSSYWSTNRFRANGRVIIDVRGFRLMDSDTLSDTIRHRFGYRSENEQDSIGAPNIVADEDLWRTSPYVYGFSFAAKKWGEFKVEHLTEIQWRDDAFESLVLLEDDKQEIRALVEASGEAFTDLIEGKGGGTIFLLHGEPGTGKTLTAEAVAEIMHRPLYSISIGELGVDPDALEKRLRIILDLASRWNAVLLLDEADIFLAARDEHNIVRNAMVGVFLRLLEYHNGCLFLSTNIAGAIDDAFLSRISLALLYSALDQDARVKVWVNLLRSAGISLNDEEIKALSRHQVNGRQIKNSIRSAQTLAKSASVELTAPYLERAVQRSETFVKELKTHGKKSRA